MSYIIQAAIIGGAILILVILLVVFFFKLKSIYNEAVKRKKYIEQSKEDLKSAWRRYLEVKNANNYKDLLNPFYHSEGEKRMEEDRQALVEQEEQLNKLIADYNEFVRLFPNVIYTSMTHINVIDAGEMLKDLAEAKKGHFTKNDKVAIGGFAAFLISLLLALIYKSKSNND